MSVSIYWELVRPGKKNRLPGTSNDWTVYEKLFHNRTLTRHDWVVLNAMHLATRLDESLWGALADAVEELLEEAEIEVTAEW